MVKVRKDYILEAIDQLRRRKARPDMNRICNYVFRRYSASCKDTAIALEKLVEAEVVVKVDYKGFTSYRNAAKWSMFSYYKSKQEHDFVTILVCKTVAELILIEPNYLDIGVPYDVLCKYVARKDKRFTKQYFNYILENEVEGGGLVKLPNGNYFVGDMDAVGKRPDGAEKLFSCQADGSSSSDLSSTTAISDPTATAEMVKNIKQNLLVRRRKKPNKKKLQPVLLKPSPPVLIGEERKKDGPTSVNENSRNNESGCTQLMAEESKIASAALRAEKPKAEELVKASLEEEPSLTPTLEVPETQDLEPAYTQSPIQQLIENYVKKLKGDVNCEDTSQSEINKQVFFAKISLGDTPQSGTKKEAKGIDTAQCETNNVAPFSKRKDIAESDAKKEASSSERIDIAESEPKENALLSKRIDTTHSEMKKEASTTNRVDTTQSEAKKDATALKRVETAQSETKKEASTTKRVDSTQSEEKEDASNLRSVETPQSETEKEASTTKGVDTTQSEAKKDAAALRRELNSALIRELTSPSNTKKKASTTKRVDTTQPEKKKDASTLKRGGMAQSDTQSEKREASTSKRVDLVDLNLNGRRKRSKKIVFDPSDNNLPKLKRCKKGKPPLPTKISPPASKSSSPNKQVRKNSCDSVEKVKKSDLNNTTSIFQPVCSICDCNEKRVGGSLDSFISCTDCITKVHLKCFEDTKAPGSLVKVNMTNWLCSNCKTCSVCEDSAEVDKLLICYACDEAYHAVCHDTISNCKTKISKENDKWICRGCFLTSQIELADEAMKLSAEEFPTFKPESTSLSHSLNCSQAASDSESVDQKEPINVETCFNDPFEGYPIDESVPDASKWSSEDVYKYFTKYFQQSIAEIFKKQEIDGLSLLLMKRCDILSDFNLKLGPALKVYGHVKRLQIRRTAPQLLWL